jgi:hypothetical protein
MRSSGLPQPRTPCRTLSRTRPVARPASRFKIKNAFHTALEAADIKDFTCMTYGIRSVAELFGHRGLRMVMRYPHQSREHLTAEVGLLDSTPASPPAPVAPTENTRSKTAKKGQRASTRDESRAKVVDFRRELARRTGRFPQLAHP